MSNWLGVIQSYSLLFIEFRTTFGWLGVIEFGILSISFIYIYIYVCVCVCVCVYACICTCISYV